MTKHPVVEVLEEWKERATAVARLPHIAAYASNFENFYVGMLAELAVIHYLVNEVADLPAMWLSPLPHGRKGGGHQADITWNGLELDVKLLARSTTKLTIKKNAQVFHHVFVEWHRRMQSFRILGVLLPYPPETFEPPVTLKGFTNRRTGAGIVGWHVPLMRLQPLAVLTPNTEVEA